MASDSFVHLHLHTQYSVLDGAVRIGDLMKRAAELEMPAVAMTDHGNVFGAVEFFQTAKKAGIKPIIGCEVYLAPGDRKERKMVNGKASSHLTLLVQNEVGYQNLIKLVSDAYLDGFYYKPRIDKELLAAHSEGLICLSGCLNGEVNNFIQAEQLDKARETIIFFKNTFGPEHFYLEIHDHGIEAQSVCTKQMVEFAKEFDLPLVAANDVHFLQQSHHEAHDVLICIGTGKMVTDENRMHYSDQLYFKTAEEMRTLFSELPEACDNTLKIAEMCDFEMDFESSHYPEYAPPGDVSREECLRKLCSDGLRERYGDRVDTDPELNERLEYELGVIEKMGFVSYFLITWDFINYAREQGIPVGPGRGSAAGSMVAYVLRITDVDPLRFSLIFERFLNPERVSPPDVDIDFCVNRRVEVIDYVRRKYGTRAVSQIVTFNTLGAKNTIRDVARVMGMGYGDADRIAKMIPTDIGIKLKEAVEKNDELAAAIKNEDNVGQLWDYALLLEGLVRNTGVHAAGVVIGDRDLANYIPLAKTKDDEVVTQYAMGPLTDLGMLKMDFLGLKNLTVIQDAVELILKREPDFVLEDIPLDDRNTYDLLNRGETIGVFQLESGGMAALCKSFDVKNIEEVSALIALYRPGPMDLIPDFVARKKGKKKVKYAHPLLEEVSSTTYGVMIYQEQVQKAANVLAGYSLGEADLLRRAMGKKDPTKMAKERVKFVAGCKEHNDIDDKLASSIFDTLEKFAGYGFNKSHSAAYAIVSYRTAYLKANYGVEFLCGLLSNEINNTDKIAVFVAECKRMGIEIMPPDVNRSLLKFAPEQSEGAPGIRFGLAAIKNVGAAAMEEAIAEREKVGPFEGLEDFCNRLDSRKVNKKILESLVRSGAFDFTGRERAELFAAIDQTLASASATHRDRAAGQVALFDMLDESISGSSVVEVVDYEPWSMEEKLTAEKELLGFYVTGHPLDRYREVFENEKIHEIGSLHELENKAACEIGGVLTVVDKRFTKKDGKPFAIVQLEDLTGSLEIMIWSEAFEKAASKLEVGRVVAVSGKVSTRDDSLRMSADKVRDLHVSDNQRPLRLHFPHETTTVEQLHEVRHLLLKHPGSRPIELQFFYKDGRKIRISADERYGIDLTNDLKRDLAPWLVA